MTPLNTALKKHFNELVERLPPLPGEVEWLMPLREIPETTRVFELFLDMFYPDSSPRTLILGINPGRFGSGVTNVSFTDPVRLEQDCGIPNSFPKREELSAQFVYRVIQAFGGVQAFYRHFFIHSVVPFGFVKGGKNYNYYDEKPLQDAMIPYIKFHLEGLLDLGMSREVCYCLGEGKNFRFLSGMNEREGYFDKIIPLSHPRFIMQYRRKQVEDFVEKYVKELQKGIPGSG